MNKYIDLKIMHAVLDKVKLQYKEQITPHMLDNLNVKVLDEIIDHGIYMLFSTLIAGKSTEYSYETTEPIEENKYDFIEIPTTWFEHFKLSLYNKHPRLLKLIKNKWPVKSNRQCITNTKIIKNITHKTITNVCPHIPIKNDREIQAHITWLNSFDELNFN